MRILITGGAGFIGTHLARQLVSRGHEVSSLDLKRSAIPVPGVAYHLGDVVNSPLLSVLMKDVDVVYHLAALVSVPLCESEPTRGYLSNVMATIRVLETLKEEGARRGRMPKLAFSGSSVVYGNSVGLGQACHESRISTNPLSFYGAQKLSCEQAIQLFSQRHGVPSVLFRFFNVFGPGQDRTSPYSGVITIFSSKIDQGQPLVVNGAGDQTRDFVSVHDVVSALERVTTLPAELCRAEAINLGSGRSVTIRDLARTMIQLTGNRVALLNGPARAGDVAHSLANIRRATEVLGWQPRVGLKDGLGELLRQQFTDGLLRRAAPPRLTHPVDYAIS